MQSTILTPGPVAARPCDSFVSAIFTVLWFERELFCEGTVSDISDQTVTYLLCFSQMLLEMGLELLLFNKV
jgi:hypothetical protein